MDSLESPQTWAKRHFGGIEMADVRRVARAVTVAEAMAKHPGHSIPQMFEQPYEVKAAYHLFNLEAQCFRKFPPVCYLLRGGLMGSKARCGL